MGTIERFISEHGITADAEIADDNPNVEDGDSVPMNHYLVILRCGEGAMAVPFSQGLAHEGEPDAATVLDCIVSDVTSVENEPDWLAWAKELGYESIEDADRARRIHGTIQRQAVELRELLGEDALNELLWDTERL